MRRLVPMILACGAASSLLVPACGSSDDRTPFAPAASSSDAGADGMVSVGRDAGSSCTGPDAGAACSRLKLAFTRLYMGDTDRGHKPASYAWQYYGEDYDGLHSNSVLNGECLPPEGQPQYAASDGLNGYDNEFGHQMLPLLEKWDPTPSQASDDALKAGARRPIIMLGQLGAGRSGPRLRAFFTYFFSDGRAEPELASYDAATFENGVFDSGPSSSPVTIELMLGPQPFRAVVHRLRVRFDLAPDGKAIAGQLSGAIKVADLETAMTEHIGRTAPAECGNFEIVKKRVASVVDVLSDGRRDRTARCDAISFGVGFEAEPVEVTGAAPLPPALTSPCP